MWGGGRVRGFDREIVVVVMSGMNEKGREEGREEDGRRRCK